MADAAADVGADLRDGQRVTRLERSGDRVTAVVTDQDRIPGDAVVTHPGPARRLPAAGPPAPAPAAPAARAVRRGAARRNRPDLAAPGAPHPLLWRGLADHVRRTHPHRAAHERSVTPHHPAHHHRPRARSAGPPSALHPRAPPQHRHRTGRRRVGAYLGPATGTRCCGSCNGAAWTASRPPSRRSASSPRHLARPPAMPRGHPSRPPTPLRRQGRSGRGTWSGGTENAVLAGCGTTPGVGVPTVLVSGKLPPHGSPARLRHPHRRAPRRRTGGGRRMTDRELDAAGIGDPAARGLPPLPRPERAAREDLLPRHPAAAGRAQTRRARSVRLRPAGPTTSSTASVPARTPGGGPRP